MTTRSQHGKSIKTLMMGSAAVMALSGISAPVYAQSDGAADDNVIIVTARKQEEGLQEVPVTVTAIGGDTLDKFQVDEIADVTSRVPALNVQVGGSGSGGQISLRGVGSSNISASFDSAVAFDFDGVQVSTMRIVQAGFFDVAQIDVLKGPQSLFFGKSASAGVFAVRSADPTPDWEVGVKASHEFEENGTTIGGYISGPISDTLGIRLAAQYQNIEEYVKLAPGTPAFNPNGTRRDARGLKNLVTRLTLQWDPSDDFSANFKLNYVRNENDGAIGHSDINCGANGIADPVVLLGNPAAGIPFSTVIPSNVDCNDSDGLYHTADASPALTQLPPQSPVANRFNGTPFGETDIWFGRLKWDWNATDTLTLSSVTGFLSLDAIDIDSYGYVGVGPAFSPLGPAAIPGALAAVNTPGSPQGVGGSDPVNKTQQLTQEFRLASDFDGMFNFMAGVFYESRKIDFNTSQQAVNISLIAPDPITGSTFDYHKRHQTKTEAFSVFGSVTLDLTDQLELSGGLRWTDEHKVNTISIPYVHAFLGPSPNFVGSGFFSGPIRFSDSNFSPEASIKYQVTPDVNVYAAFKTGFKSGGIDNSALPSSSLGVAAANGDFSSLIYQSETGLGGEIGVKSQFADRTFTLNASAFYYVFDDLQVQNFDATTIQFQTFNASQLTSQGVDVEWAWQTPLEGLNFSGSIAYTDAEFTKDFFTNPGPDLVLGTADDTSNLRGRKAARAPKFAGNVAFDWTTPIGDSFELGLNGNLQYSGSYFTNEDTVNDIRQSSYVSIDGAISIGDSDGAWKLSLIGVNLTDKLWINTSGGRPFLPGPNNFGIPVGDDQVVTQNRGRQVFVEAKFKF